MINSSIFALCWTIRPKPTTEASIFHRTQIPVYEKAVHDHPSDHAIQDLLAASPPFALAGCNVLSCLLLQLICPRLLLFWSQRQEELSAQAEGLSEHCLLPPTTNKIAWSKLPVPTPAQLRHLWLNQLLAPGIGLPQSSLASSASPCLSRRHSAAPGHLHQPAHWKWYTCTSAMLHHQLIQSQRGKSGRQSATLTLAPVPQQATHSEGEAHPETGPTLPANSFTNRHRQLAAGRAYSSMQSGAIPVKSQWFSTGLAILPAHLSQVEESNTKGS